MAINVTNASTFPEDSRPTDHKTQSSQNLAALLSAILVPLIGILVLCCCCLKHRRVAGYLHRTKRGAERPFYAQRKAGRMRPSKNRTNDSFEVLTDVGGSDSALDSISSDTATVPTRSLRSLVPVADGSNEKAVSGIDPLVSVEDKGATPSQDIYGEQSRVHVSDAQRWSERRPGRSQEDSDILLVAMTERLSTRGEEGPPCYEILFPGEGDNIV